MNPTKGDIINFTTKTSGLFEIIEPIMENDELFDANLLEQTINSLIEEGKRNFAIDLSKIGYLYSDSINKFINLNHRILNVYGRLALLSPSEKVSKILKRAGIQNFIKIYLNITELKKASDEIIQQTTTLNLNDIKAYKEDKQNQRKSLSEFEDLRSEIGKAIEGTPNKGSVLSESEQSKDIFTTSSQSDSEYYGEEQGEEDYKMPNSTIQQQPQNTFFSDNSIESDLSPATMQLNNLSDPPLIQPPPKPKFDYSQFENLTDFEIPPQQQTQQYGEHPGQQYPETNSTQQSENLTPPTYREHSFPSFPEQPLPSYPRQPSPLHGDYSYYQEPPVQEELKQTQPIPSSTDSTPKTLQTPYKKTSFDRDDFFGDEFAPKKPPIIPIALSAMAIIIVIGVVLFIINYAPFEKSSTSLTQNITPQEPQSTPITPEIQTVQPTEKPTEPTVPEKVAHVPAKPIIKKETVPKVRERTTTTTVAKPVKPAISPVKPTTATPPVKPATSHRIIITTSPSNASVIVNGLEQGKTPFTWDDPDVYGPVVISLEKDGYTSKEFDLEYVGGTEKRHVTLSKEPDKPRVVTTSRREPEPKPEPKIEPTPKVEPTPRIEATPKIEPTPKVETKPKVVAKPKVVTKPKVVAKPKPKPVVKPKTTPAKELDFASDEPKAAFESDEPKSTVSSGSSSSPPPAPVKKTASTTSANEGTIFISSLPPMADVFMDGKKIGKTNVAELKITAGTHVMRFVKGSKKLEKKMSFTSGKNPSQLIRLK